jgi:16S rRNA (guanine966-N2)-methyltransferase
MRIIGGEFRGRKLKAPDSWDIRPTTGRLRESIFSSLEHQIGGFQGKSVADIFSGTGALGLEALSRGAEKATWVEKHKSGISLLKDNIAALGVQDKSRILKADARHLPKAVEPFDVVFMDPPYGQDLAAPALLSLKEKAWITQKSLVVLEADKKDVLEMSEDFEEFKTLKQGFRVVYFIRLR